MSSDDVGEGLDELNTEKSNVGHAHSGAEITSGTVAVARIGTGTKDTTTFYRGDGQFVEPPATTPATEATAGVAQIASTSDASTGTNDAKIMTPAKTKTVTDTKADLAHDHDAADVISGTIDPDRLGANTPDDTKFLRGDSSWVTLGGSEPPASETQIGVSEFATAAETLTGTDTTRTTHPAGVKAVADTKAPVSHAHAGADITSGTVDAARLPVASETQAGVVELATSAETATGTDTTRAAHPAGVKAVADTKAPTTRQIGTVAPLAGGGDLSADRTLTITAATPSAAGSMSSADKAKLDAYGTESMYWHAYQSAAQSDLASAGTGAQLTFTSLLDSTYNGAYSGSARYDTATSKFTAPVTGIYEVGGSILLTPGTAPSTAQQARLYVSINDALSYLLDWVFPSGGSAGGSFSTTTFALTGHGLKIVVSAGQTISLRVFHTLAGTGSTLPDTSGGSGTAYFYGMFLRTL